MIHRKSLENIINLFARKLNQEELNQFSDAVLENILKSKDVIASLEFLSQYLAMTNSNKNELKKLLESIKESRDKENGVERLKNYLEKAGDKTESVVIAKQRDLIAKKIEADFKDFDTKKPVIYKEGDDVIYLLQGKTKEEWNKLTGDEK